MPWKRKRSSLARRLQRRADAVKPAADAKPGGGGFLMLGLVVLVGGVLVFAVASRQKKPGNDGGSSVREEIPGEAVEVVAKPSDEQRGDWDRFEREATAVAREFLAESDPAVRLGMVREADAVGDHHGDYPPEALSMGARDVRKLGVKSLDGERMMSFAVTLENDSVRLLNVVEEDGRLLVDWDSYARHGTMAWDALMGAGGMDAEALVRVFVQPGDYYNPPFDDPRVWTSFRLVSPDVDRPLYAFAKADDPTAAKMRGLVMQNGSFRQHMTLRIKRHAGAHDDTLFSVEELVAVGWVVK